MLLDITLQLSYLNTMYAIRKYVTTLNILAVVPRKMNRSLTVANS